MKRIDKYSLGMGDRFAHQGKAQLQAVVQAQKRGIHLTPVWNKSNREHLLIKSEPSSVRAEAEAAVAALKWSGPYHVDADHINLTTVDRFIEASDFYTIDVADFTGRATAAKDIEAFLADSQKYLGALSIPGLGQPLEINQATLEGAARKFLSAMQAAGEIYRHIAKLKGDDFIAEVSVDETDTPQTPAELLLILLMLAREKVPCQTIAPKFTGRFNKGVDYVGDLARFEQEFDQDLCVVRYAVREFGLPDTLKLSVHSGSDKFSLYPIINRLLKKHDAGVHVKTAGTTWLEEVIGLAESGNEGLKIAQNIYAEAHGRFDELVKPYATVVDIDPAKLPSPAEVGGWSSVQYCSALRHDLSSPEYNLHFRQLIHVSFKIAAAMGDRYLNALRANEAIIALNVTGNLYARHIVPFSPRLCMKTFITENFLLETETARELYFNQAATQPIYDYHCHLSPKQIAENYRFRNLYDIWLAGDHYKWRAMRANGIAERFCTGDASDEEKYQAFVRTVPYTLRNPLYHWSHLELLRYFGIDDLINEESGAAIWKQANAQLTAPDYGVHAILAKNRVAVICTTDDPADSLEHHQAIRQQGLQTRVYPTFRPDAALNVANPALFNLWCQRLAAVANSTVSTFSDFLAALKQRHDFFHEQGCRLSDHGLESCFASECDEKQAARIFDNARLNKAATPDEARQFGTFLMLFFGHLDAARGWTKQLHLGAMRNNNGKMRQALGPDTGFDSIGDFPQAAALGWYLNRLESNGDLPKMMLYNLNPGDNYTLATMAGNFQDGSVAGKIQFGSGWWFLDQLEGMTWQINALSNLGLLRRFVGMLTDSRSFLSYTRHEYFRRLLCNLLGNDVEKGLLPRDMDLLGTMTREICFENARGHFGLELAPEYQAGKPV